MDFDYSKLHGLKHRIASKTLEEFKNYVKPHFTIDKKTVGLCCKLMKIEPTVENQIQAMKDLQTAIIDTGKLEWLFIDACFSQDLGFKSGCTYGLSFPVDSAYNFSDIQAVFDSKNRNRKMIKLIRLVIDVDLDIFEPVIQFEQPETSKQTDQSSKIEDSKLLRELSTRFKAAAIAAREILSADSVFKDLEIVPVISIKAKNPVDHAKNRINTMRKALSLFVKVLNDEEVPLEGVVLGLELLCNPLVEDKAALRKDVFHNFHSWTEVLPPALGVINIELNEEVEYKVRRPILDAVEEALKSPVCSPCFFNFCLGSFLFYRFLNEKTYPVREGGKDWANFFGELEDIQRRVFESSQK